MSRASHNRLAAQPGPLARCQSSDGKDATVWHAGVIAYAEQHPHPAWGPAHCRRVYALALELADREGAPVDRDSLFAAAHLHDLGAFAPYRVEGVDHAERSAQVAEELLAAAGFPADKLSLVQAIIRGHMYRADPGESREAVLFHDADTLDFLGAVGVARILAIVGLDDWAPDLPSAVRLLQRFVRELPAKLITVSARQLAVGRVAEMKAFLAALELESQGLAVL
jgi:uncharacterized protein